jgi:hypothetical protein
VTDPQGFADAVHRFDSELDAAVVRARRIASEARETSAKFRRETRQLAEQVKAGTASGGRTDDRLLRTASGFRTDNGLPVRDLPVPEPAATPSPLRTTGSRRPIAPSSDDDEDFSQEQIMR